MALLDRSVRELLDAFAAADPTPGGGSAAALASSIGASLLMMVAALPKTRNNSEDDRTALARASADLADARGALTDAVDADTAAYDAVVAAYRLPKQTEDDKQSRKTEVQRALKHATDVPLGVMRVSAAALRQADVVSAHGHTGASSDVGVARLLLRAGLDGARLNVEINLASIADEAYTRAVRQEIDSLT